MYLLFTPAISVSVASQNGRVADTRPSYKRRPMVGYAAGNTESGSNSNGYKNVMVSSVTRFTYTLF